MSSSKTVKTETKEISVDFFSVHVGDHTKDTLLEVMEKFYPVNQTAEDKNYERYEGDDIIRLSSFYAYKDDAYCGKWKKFKKGLVPTIDSVYEESEREIDLSEGDHVIDSYYFLYMANTSTLVCARNKDSRSANRLAAYLREKTGYFGLQFKPKVKSSAMDRLRKANIHRFTVNFVADSAIYTLDTKDPVYKIAQLREVFGGLKITLIIEASKDGACPIHRDSVINSAQTLGNGFVDFNKFLIEGPTAEDLQDDTIDFINNRFGDTIKIKYTTKILDSQIYEELLKVYKRRVHDLRDKEDHHD